MTTTRLTRKPAPNHTPRLASGRHWALSGVAAGITAIISIQASMSLSFVQPGSGRADANLVVDHLADETSGLIVFHLATVVSAVLVTIFAVGLHRRLSARLYPASLIPTVAASGLGLVVVAQLIGSGLDTEFLFAAQDPDRIVPESTDFYGHWIATIPWLWVGAGLTGLAVATAALRHRAVPRWIGVVGATLGGLTLLVGISPLQYLAGFTGPVWLLVTALGFATGDRAART